MSNFTISAISAFFAVGKRFSLDIKLHGTGMSTVLIQIDTSSKEEFMHRWCEASAGIRQCVIAWFGPNPADPEAPLFIVNDELEANRRCWDMLNYATDVRNHMHGAETLNAIMELVYSVNKQIATGLR